MEARKHRVNWIVSFGALLTAILMLAPTLADAQTPSTLVVVVNEKTTSVLAIIDPVAGKVVGRVPTGPDPHIVAMSEDGKLAFVANTNGHEAMIPDGDSISVIDVAARKEIRRVEVGNTTRPSDIRVAGGKVYFTATGFKAIGRYDPARNKVDHFFGLGQGGPDAFAISKDLNTIFAVNPSSDTVSVIENALVRPVPKGPSGWTVSLIQITKGQRPESIDISPDGKEAWTANEEGGGVSIIDVAKRIAIQDVNLQTKHANRLRFTPDGTRVLVLDRDTGTMVVVDAATRKVVGRVRFPGEGVGERVGNLAVSPDGSRVYVSVRAQPPQHPHYVAVIDLKTLSVTSRIETSGAPNGVACARCR